MIGPPAQSSSSCWVANTSPPIVLPVKGSLGPSLSSAAALRDGRRGVREREVFSEGRRRRRRDESEREDEEVDGGALGCCTGAEGAIPVMEDPEEMEGVPREPETRRAPAAAVDGREDLDKKLADERGDGGRAGGTACAELEAELDLNSGILGRRLWVIIRTRSRA